MGGEFVLDQIGRDPNHGDRQHVVIVQEQPHDFVKLGALAHCGVNVMQALVLAKLDIVAQAFTERGLHVIGQARDNRAVMQAAQGKVGFVQSGQVRAGLGHFGSGAGDGIHRGAEGAADLGLDRGKAVLIFGKRDARGARGLIGRSLKADRGRVQRQRHARIIATHRVQKQRNIAHVARQRAL